MICYNQGLSLKINHSRVIINNADWRPLSQSVESSEKKNNSTMYQHFIKQITVLNTLLNYYVMVGSSLLQ